MDTIYDKLTAIADSIREKTGKSGSLTLDDMAYEISTIKGSADLNFEVIAYESEEALLASSPVENTIGVVTSQEITSWIFNAKEPTEPAEGMLTIYTGPDSNIKFNALKKNNIQLNIITAKQYVNATWMTVTTHVYQNGEWRFVYDGKIYESGVQHKTLAYQVTGGAPNPSFNSEYISIRGRIKKDISVVVYTKDKIPVNGFNKLTMKYNKLQSYSYHGSNVQIGLVKEIAVNTGGSFINPVAFSGKAIQHNDNAVYGPGEFEVDISSVPAGDYYVAFSIGQSNNGTTVERYYTLEVTEIFLS